eukprot:gene1369-biopygen7761
MQESAREKARRGRKGTRGGGGSARETCKEKRQGQNGKGMIQSAPSFDGNTGTALCQRDQISLPNRAVVDCIINSAAPQSFLEQHSTGAPKSSQRRLATKRLCGLFGG